MKTDLVLSPLGAHVPDMIAAAEAADAGGFDTVWTYDHFSGLVQHAPWSRDPFVALAAIAASTDRINIGVLVANVVNRHPAQLACAVNSLQSLAPGRVLVGVGAGSSRGTAWAAEQAAIGRSMAAGPTRRALLAESIDALRAIWRGEEFAGEHVRAAAAMAVTDGAPVPPIIVGASTLDTVAVACTKADGVNLLPEADLAGAVAYASRRRPEGFEIGAFVALDPSHPLGGDAAPLESLDVQRRTLYVSAPFPVDAIAGIGQHLGVVGEG